MRPLPLSLLQNGAALLHEEFSRNGEGAQWKVGCHTLLHVLDFTARVADGKVDCVTEQAVERMNQRLKRCVRRYHGDIASAFRHVNAISSLTLNCLND